MKVTKKHVTCLCIQQNLIQLSQRIFTDEKIIPKCGKFKSNNDYYS